MLLHFLGEWSGDAATVQHFIHPARQSLSPVHILPGPHSSIHPSSNPPTQLTPQAVVHILAVHPTYHRRGLGTMLLRPGLEDADKAGAQTYIEASPSGLPLYLRHGWVQVDELVIDMKPHGGEGVERNPCLMREPGAGSKVGKAEG